ncbi:Glyoxalase/bleomycin resistance protein/dioxygenase [Enhygromyxa salina]|uniref:Glyoxalase/bleomycin resistance protein/dioxygenase n=1 Tax=Enhygromyxa salina TaxID=215803 RepID=A0A0C1ZHT9_9BACT|nr:VOC family protein [Enhygromyxa salina]KIG17159.1 Glyoxalase/bleomycin resistance protein/dioxygenase [Enhygromyxa salina]
MSLGAFSVSLAVKDIDASIAFYEQLGFTSFGGDPKQGWAILRCGAATIGLFAGMFEANILTFNPGWSDDAKPLDAFEDVREIQARLQAAGVEITTPVEPGDGPAHILLQDPDGNQIMFDQHVPRSRGAGGS